MKSRIIILAATLAAAMAVHADVSETFPEVNGPYDPTGPFPGPSTDIGTDAFTIPLGDTVTGATLSGIFGSTSQFYGSTAEFDLYANGNFVTSTYDFSPDPYNNVVSFDVPLTGAALSSLDSGSVTLSYVQESDYNVRLSSTTLDIAFGPSSSVPDVTGISSLVMAALGLAGFGRFARKA
jgi:hypothetical protein